VETDQKSDVTWVAPMVHNLAQSLGGVRPVIDAEALRALYATQQYTKLVGTMRPLMEVAGVRLRVGYVNSGRDSSPAWMEIPVRMPVYGSPGFFSHQFTMYLQKSFLSKESFEIVVFAIAHELAHILLEARYHPLRKDERAVDLVAMMMGFRSLLKFSRIPRVTEERVVVSEIAELVIVTRQPFSRLGYLSDEQVHYAAHLMNQLAPR
jgi:hypothetical protein